MLTTCYVLCTEKMANFEGDSDDLDFDQEGTELECGGNLRRPMNAFLIFCKRHRTLVREKYPHLENRGVTKILGELWANLDGPKKESYTQLAKQYKEAFIRANPAFKWYKQPSPPGRTLVTRPTNQKLPKLESHPGETSTVPPQSPTQSFVAAASSLHPSPCGITPGKLADETQLGGLTSLITPAHTSAASTTTAPPPPLPSSSHIQHQPKSFSKPPKKRYLENLENGTIRSQETDTAQSANVASSSSPLHLLPKTSSPSPYNSSINDDAAASSSASVASTTTTTATTDCSALLKLAEVSLNKMCSKERVRDEPSKATVINGRSLGGTHSHLLSSGNSISHAGATSSSSPVTVVTTTAESSAGNAFNHTNVPASVSPITPTKSITKPAVSNFSPFSKMIASAVEARAEYASSGCRSSSNRILSGITTVDSCWSSSTGPITTTAYPFSSSPAASERRLAGKNLASFLAASLSMTAESQPPARPPDQLPDEPLNLTCQTNTYWANNQYLINCIVDGAFGNAVRSANPVDPANSGPTLLNSEGIATYSSSFGNGGAAPPVGEAPSEGDNPSLMSLMDTTGDSLLAIVPPKKSKGVSHSSASSSSSSATSHNRYVDGEADAVSHHHNSFYHLQQQPPDHHNHHQDAYDLYRPDTMTPSSSSSTRKPQRSCKGKRYQSFMSEGLLQPVKERKVSSSRKPSSSDCGDGDSVSAMSSSGRVRTPSDSSESRKSDRDDGLKTTKTSRSSTPTDEDMELVSSRPSNMESATGGRQRRDLDHHDHTRKRFKTGDFDLEEHIAALPNCNVEALDRKKHQQRRQSPSSFSPSPSLTPVAFRRGGPPPFMHRDERKREAESATHVYDVANLSDGGSDKADSSSSESRGGDDKPILVGSQKRKARKRSITHLEPTSNSHTAIVESGTLGNHKLAALAEVAVGEGKMSSASNQNDSDSPTESA